MEKLKILILVLLITNIVQAQQTSKVRLEKGATAEELRRQKDWEVWNAKMEKLSNLIKKNNISAPSLMGFGTTDKEVIQKIIARNQELIDKINGIAELKSLSKEVHTMSKSLGHKTTPNDAITNILDKANENIRRGNARLNELEKITNNQEIKVANWSLKDDKKKDNWKDSKEKKDPWGLNNKQNNTTIINKDEDSYKIEYKNGKYGVISNMGKILIPYQYDKITKYDNTTGIAEVEILISQNEQKVSCYYKGYVNSRIFKTGFIEKNGNWVIQPKKIAYISTNYNGWNGISIFTSNCDYDCKQRAKRRWTEEDKNCWNEIKNLRDKTAKEFENQGYKTIILKNNRIY